MPTTVPISGAVLDVSNDKGKYVFNIYLPDRNGAVSLNPNTAAMTLAAGSLAERDQWVASLRKLIEEIQSTKK